MEHIQHASHARGRLEAGPGRAGAQEVGLPAQAQAASERANGGAVAGHKGLRRRLSFNYDARTVPLPRSVATQPGVMGTTMKPSGCSSRASSTVAARSQRAGFICTDCQ